MSDDNKGESIFDRLRRETREQQQREFEAEQRRRNLAGVFDGSIVHAELYRRFGLTSNDNREERNNQ